MLIRESLSCLSIIGDGGTVSSDWGTALLPGVRAPANGLWWLWWCWISRLWRLGSPTQVPTPCLSRPPLPGSSSATRRASGLRSPMNLEADGGSKGCVLWCRWSPELLDLSNTTDGVSGFGVPLDIVVMWRASVWFSVSRPCVHRFYRCSNLSIIACKRIERSDLPFAFCSVHMHFEELSSCDCLGCHWRQRCSPLMVDCEQREGVMTRGASTSSNGPSSCRFGSWRALDPDPKLTMPKLTTLKLCYTSCCEFVVTMLIDSYLKKPE